MTEIQFELSEATAQAAREAGLLTPQALDRLLNEALKRRLANVPLFSNADRVADAGTPYMTNITVSLPDDLAQQAQAAGLARGERNG